MTGADHAARREALGVTQARLSKKAGVHQSSVLRLERRSRVGPAASARYFAALEACAEEDRLKHLGNAHRLAELAAFELAAAKATA